MVVSSPRQCLTCIAFSKACRKQRADVGLVFDDPHGRRISSTARQKLEEDLDGVYGKIPGSLKVDAALDYFW